MLKGYKKFAKTLGNRINVITLQQNYNLRLQRLMTDINQKEKWTQDELYDFLTSNDVTITRLSDLMGMTIGMVASNFKHHVTRHGKPRSFNYQQTAKLNEALQQLAKNMRQCLLRYAGTEQKKGNLGKVYYPILRQQMNDGVGQYFNLVSLTFRVLGWNRTKKRNVLECNKENSKVSGCITAQEAELINKEILAVAGMLESHEIVCTSVNDGDGASKENVTTEPPRRNRPRSEKGLKNAAAYGSRRHHSATTEQAFDSKAMPWDNTALSLPERSRLFRKQYTGGVLLFRVNGGYTAEGDDALLLQQMDSSIVPYTDVETDLVTAWMDNEQMSNILPRIIAHDKRVMFTDMYVNS